MVGVGVGVRVWGWGGVELTALPQAECLHSGSETPASHSDLRFHTATDVAATHPSFK